MSWKGVSELYLDEAKHRQDIEPDTLCEYGISPLDDALIKIGSNELILIGAETGTGKSEAGLIIAQHNAKKGKKVGIFYLEGGPEEAIQRMKWREISKRFYQRYPHKEFMDYKEWRYNVKHIPKLDEIEAEVYLEYEKLYKDNLQFYENTKDFTVQKLHSALWDWAELLTKNIDLDLIIIDHLQYFSLTKAESEITEITKILRSVRGIIEHYNKPIILISHLRKKTGGKHGKNIVVPAFDDFYGSSNIPKISTTAITLSNAARNNSLKHNIYPTYLRVVKSRIGMSSKYVFLADFDLKTRSYRNEYDIYQVNSFNEVAPDKIDKNDLPKWAKGAKYGFLGEEE